MTFNYNSRCGCGTKAERIYCGSPACARCIALEQVADRRLTLELSGVKDRSHMGWCAMSRALSAWMHRLGMRPAEFAAYSIEENAHYFRAHKPQPPRADPRPGGTSYIPSALNAAAGAISHE